ncbi:MFS-type transporter involved in bile tolerance, Atg22 family [Polaromonas sp. YR568]|uniref:MFS transporter n=1 Tax=Polaromonas sp. YR568 TaxID=1855301 RepID=UPI0008E02C59|nr:MFS transporter [Polaromonas sp. YR568]SFU89711.1 MFS-type transporter involved in bile tolerance, Atg22 family [Polaromonas sp. YR568]
MTRDLARLIAALVLFHGCMTGTRLAASLIALRDGYSAAAVGVLLALFALAQIFLALPAGRFADRHGFKRPIRHCVLVGAVGAGSAVFLPVFAVLCFSALTTGAAAVVVVIAIQRHAGRAISGPVQLKQVFGWLSIGTAISGFIGPLAAGLLIDHAGATAGSTTGYRAAFLLMAIFPLACWILVRNMTELPLAGVPKAGKALSAIDLLRDPGFRNLMLVNWFLQSCWDVHTFMVPVLGFERGISASVIGVILGAFAIAAAAIRVALPIIAARVQEWAVLVVAMILSALVFAVYPLMHSAVGMGICSVLLGLSLGMVQPMVMSMLHQITPEARHGEAIGLRMMAISVSSVAMPMLFGAAGTIIGITGLFWVASAIVGVGSRIAWTLKATAEKVGIHD